MSINSKVKGKRAELELAHKLAEIFEVPARRGQQYSGSPDSPDVIFHPDIHIECKRVQKLNLNQAMDQAQADCGTKQIPVVMSRMNNRPWLVTVKLDDLKDLATTLASIIKEPDDA